METKDLEWYLQEIQVQEINSIDFEDGHAGYYLDGWFAVVNEEGICAYFGNETDALRFRLDYINRKLNP